jgi:GntR family transcriptional regulator, rspAB operon transcriptional repressor
VLITSTPPDTGLTLAAAGGDDVRRPERAYRALRGAIRELTLVPGQMVLEQEAADALGMSRTPVREALTRLESEGLVRRVPRRGFAVAPLAADAMREVYEIVEALESMAVGLAAGRVAAGDAGEVELQPLDESITRQSDALAHGDLGAWVAEDERFHALLLDLSGNERLRDLVRAYDDHLHRARLLTIHARPKPVRSTAGHQAVLAAIRVGDEPGARALHQAHRRRGRLEIIEALRTLERTEQPAQPISLAHQAHQARRGSSRTREIEQ